MNRPSFLHPLAASATTALALLLGCGAPSPTLVGRVDGTLASETSGFDALSHDKQIEIEINGHGTTAFVDDDGSFATDGLPTGRVEIGVLGDGISGTLVIDDVQPGEMLEIDVRGGRDHLTIRLVRRRPGTDYFGEGEAIHIRGHHQVVHLPAGTVTEDIVIEGHHVTLFGTGNGDCSGGDRTVLTGDLVVRGHHVDLVNVSTEGRVQIDGHHTHFVRRCGKRWWKHPKHGKLSE